jgi:hypothetical protein
MLSRTIIPRLLPAFGLVVCVCLFSSAARCTDKAGMQDSDEGFNSNCANLSGSCPVVTFLNSQTLTGSAFSVEMDRFFWCTQDPNFPLLGTSKCLGTKTHYIVQVKVTSSISTLSVTSVLLNEIAVGPSILLCNGGGIYDPRDPVHKPALCQGTPIFPAVSYADSSLTRWDMSVANGQFASLVMDEQANLASSNLLITAFDSAASTTYTLGSLVPPAFTSTAAPNDDFLNASVATANPYSAVLDLSGATVDPTNDPTPSCYDGSGAPSHSVWFRLSFTSSKLVEINTKGSEFDTIVDVVTGSPGAFTEIGCNDDADVSHRGPSSVTFTASANVTYYVMVEDYTPGNDNTLMIAIQERSMLSFSPASLSFATTAVGGTSSAQNVTIGALNGTVSSIGFSTSNAEFSVFSTTCGTSLAVGSTCTVSLKFSPSSYGSRSGQLIATSNSQLSPQTYPLSGTGQAAGTTLSSLTSTGNAELLGQSVSSITFPDVLVGSSTGVKTACAACVPVALAAADLNKDGKSDIVVGYATTSPTIGTLLGNGDLTFGSVSNFGSTVNSLENVATADVNKDGNLDIIYADSGSNNIVVLFGPSFTTSTTVSTNYAAGPYRVYVADFNKDGVPDVAATVNDGFNDIVEVFLSNASGTFSGTTTTFLGRGRLAIGDFDGDGKLDIVASGTQSFVLAFGNGSGSFSTVSESSSSVFNNSSLNLVQFAAGDFNRDGRTEIIAVGANKQSLFLITVSASRQVQGTLMGKVFNSVSDVRAADVNGDGFADLLIADNGVLRVRPGSSDLLFAVENDYAYSYPVDTSLAPVLATADFGRHRRPDVALGFNSGINGVYVMPEGENGRFAPEQIVTLANSGTTALTISSISTGNAAFPVTHNCAISPSTLSAGASCTIHLNFSPTVAGQQSATLTVTDNGLGSPHQVTLNGRGAIRTKRVGQITTN